MNDGASMPHRLNLGSSDDLLPGYVNVDQMFSPELLANPRGMTLMIADLTGQRYASLARPVIGGFGVPVIQIASRAGRSINSWPLYDPEPWPWEDSIVDEIRAWDVFEHIDNTKYPGSEGITWCLNEAHRILRPGGILDLRVPCLPGTAPRVDPTHKSIWTSSTRYYYDERWNNQSGERGRLGPAYGITARFKTLPHSNIPIGRAYFAPGEAMRERWDWVPINYAEDRHKLFVRLEAVK